MKRKVSLIEKFCKTSKVAVVRAKPKMQNILSRKTKHHKPAGYIPKNLEYSTPKTFRNHLKIARNTKNQRGT